MIQKRRKKMIFNIGYQGRNIEGVVATLAGAGVTMLVDLREKPVSRIKGFSKNKLREALAAGGIGYWHMGQKLGGFTCTPDMWKDGCNEIFTWLEKNYEVLALMCMERDPLQCHRLEVSKILETEHGFTRQCL